MTPDDIAGLQILADKIAQPLNEWLIRDICRRVKKAGAITETAEYQIYRAEALGMSKDAIAKAVAQQMKTNEQSIAMLFEAVADRSIQFEDNGVMQELTAAYARITTKALNGQLKDLWATAPDKHIYTITEVYENCMDFAFGKIMTGATDATTAMRQATRELANRGIRELPNGKSGRSVSIEYATRRYVLNRMGALHAEISQSNHDKMGADGWELSAHGGCAPDHEPCQGRQYSDKDYERLNAGLERKIGTWQCKHIAYPIILGKSKPNYTDAELQELIDRNAAGVTYEGKHYTLYEAEAQRNGLESAIRRDKLRCIVSEELGDKEQLFTDQLRLSLIEQEYARFCRATGLRTQSQRLQVAGFGRAQAAKKHITANKHAVSYYRLFDLSYGQGNASIKRLNEENNLAAAHKNLLRQAVSVVKISNTVAISQFRRSTLEISLRNTIIDGEFTHEVGHAIAAHKNVYKDKKFLDILCDSVGEYNKQDTIYEAVTTNNKTVLLLNCDTSKFISPYQRCLYRYDDYGKPMKNESGEINLKALREFFAEGFRAYYFEREKLKAANPDLFQYIEELK